MLALIASALLGLYVFLPVALFDKFAAPFVRLKKNQRTRTEEVVAGILVAAIPFVVTCFLSRFAWHVGHWPFQLADAAAVRKPEDCKTVFSGLYSEHYFDQHAVTFWESLHRVAWHQFRFLSWNYAFLAGEIVLVLVVTSYYGRLTRNSLFRNTLGRLLRRKVSEWTPLLTTFLFDPKENRRVEVDLMAADGHLYRGTVEDYFLDKDGGLRGLLLKDAKRYQYSRLADDRKNNRMKDLREYWKATPGANLYVPYDKTLTLNLRYELPDKDLLDRLRTALARSGMKNVIVGTKKSQAETLKPLTPESTEAKTANQSGSIVPPKSEKTT